MSGRKRRARCMKITTRGTVELNGWLTSPMGCCCRAEGHVDSRANERTNRPPSAAVARSNRGWHSRYVGFHGSFPRRTHNTPRVMGLRPRPPRRREVHQSPVSAFVDSGRSASHLVRNLVWARYPAPEPLVWLFFPPGRWKLPISEFRPTDRKNNRVPRSVAPLGAGCRVFSRVPWLWGSLLAVA